MLLAMFEIVADGGYQINIIQRHLAKAVRQRFDLLTDRQVFVHNKHLFPLYRAKPAAGIDAGGPQVLFGNRDIQFFSSLFQMLIQLSRFQTVKPLQTSIFVLLLVYLNESMRIF